MTDHSHPAWQQTAAQMREGLPEPLFPLDDLYRVAAYLRDEARLELSGSAPDPSPWARRQRAANLLAMEAVIVAVDPDAAEGG